MTIQDEISNRTESEPEHRKSLFEFPIKTESSASANTNLYPDPI